LHPDKKDQHPINYGVPDFGVDRDIRTTHENMSEAGDFDPSKIAPHEYEDEFDLKPIWERKPSGVDKMKKSGYDEWMLH
jgi:hypothetical protein